MAWFNTSYLFKKQLTIDHTKVSGGANLSNFPVLISMTDVNLKVVGSGGSVQNTSGFDIIFTDSTETTKLDHEIEKYVSTTGEIEMWVRIPTLSASVDTIIYCYYDNSSISTTQENKTGVWDTSYKGVYHLGNGTTLSVADSTGNANGTNNGATATSGKIDGGAALASSSYISFPTTGMPTGSTLWTVETWLSYSVAPTTYTGVVGIGSNVTGESIELGFNGSALPYIGLKNVAGCIGPSTPSTGTAHHLAGVWDGTNLRLYVDGAAVGTPFGASPNIVAGSNAIGQYAGGGGFFFTGTVDETRISVGIARSAGWITTQYNNHNAPGTFITVGAAIAQSAALVVALAGSGTLSGTISQRTALAKTLAGAGTLTGAMTSPPLGPTGSWLLAWSDEFNDTTGMSGPVNGLAASKWNSGWFYGPTSPGVGNTTQVTDPVNAGTIAYFGPASIIFPGDSAVHLRLQAGVDNGGVLNGRTVEGALISTAGLLAINPAGVPVSTSAPDLRPYTINGTVTIEFRTRFPGPNASAGGYWPIFWSVNAGCYYSPTIDGSLWPGGNGYSEEIDFAEAWNGGSLGSVIDFNLHAISTYANAARGSSTPPSMQSTDFSLAYHTFTYKLTSSTITSWVDGVLNTNITPTTAEMSAQWTYPQYLLFYFEANAGATYPTTAASTPNDFMIDYVRVWTSLTVTLTATLAGTTTLISTLATNIVTRSGSHLILNGTTFRFGGTNIYWLGLIDTPAYPTQFEVDDALQTAKEMGATVVRSISLGVSVGSSLSVETSLGTFNDAAFDSIDYAIYRAGLLGIKLIIPLTDNFHYYTGGKHTFTDWRSLSDENLFYTNATVIADFEAYISHILNHVNTYSGLTLKNDPTIMAWETGNEISGAPSTWTTTIANYIKSIDSMHLVTDGSLQLTAGPLAIASVDGYTNHYYPPVGSTLSSDATAVSAASKVFFVGEYDWLATPAVATASQDTTTAAPGGGTASARIDETQAGSQDSYVQFAAGAFSLAATTTYTFSFYARATVGCSFTVIIMDHTTFVTYFSQSFTVTTSWAQYTGATFTVPAGTTADIYVEAGRIGTSLWLDLMSLSGGGPNLLPNPSFETAGLASWSFSVTGVSSLASWLSAIEGNSAIAGDCFWSLFSHASGSGFLIHNDGYSLYYPPGQTSDQQTREQALRTHAYTMSGLAVPAQAIPVAPSVINVTVSSPNLIISWQGVMGAATYQLERSTTGPTGSFTVLGSAYTDFSTPVTDAGVAYTWYRIKAANQAGVYGPYSAVVASPPLSLYGSNVAATSPATAGKSATTTGGTEIAAVTTAPASGSGYVECFALGGVSTVNASLPAPSGKGWVLDLPLLEGMRLIAGNWAASVAVSDANGGGPVNSYTIRFWQRSSGGTYAIIGSLVLSASQVISTLRVVKAFLAAAMPQTDFAVGDKLYIDFFINANGWASDVLSVYVSSSGSAGVVGDMEVDTAGFIPSGTAGVVTSYIPRALSALLVITSTALLDTLIGTGTLTGASAALSAALAITFSGGGVLSGQLTANLALPATTLAGAGSLPGIPSLATNLATSQFAGSSALSASILARTVLTGQLAGSSTLASTFQLATSLTGTLTGTGQVAGSLTATLTLAGIVLPAVSALVGTVGLITALGTTMAGGGQLAGAMALTSNLSTTLSGVSQLSALLTASLALPGRTLAGSGTLAGTISTATPVALSTTMAGGGALNGTPTLATSLTGTPAGVGALSSTMTASFTLAGITLAGSGVLIGATARGATLSASMIGASTLGASLSAALTLSGVSLIGTSAFSGVLTGAGGLVGTLPGVSTCAGSLSAALTLIGTSFAGVDMLSATVQANTVLSTTLSGASALSGVPSARTALGAILVGASTLPGTMTLATALIGTVSSVGALAGAAGRSTALSVVLPGNGQLAGAASAQTFLTSSFSGIGTVAFTVLLRTSFSITLAGAGNVTSASLSPRAALALSLAGAASLSGLLTVPVLAYLTATWKTRDGQVVWVTRDEQEATWKTRDGQVTWKIRS